MTQLNDSEKIEILIDQVGLLTESITALRLSVESGFTELKTITERQAQTAERQERNIERQERNIDRLMNLVELLMQERRS